MSFVERLVASRHEEPAPKVNSQAFYDIVHSRRSVRRFATQRIPDAAFARIIRAGIEAPSSSNLQLWHFVRVTSPEMRKKLAWAAFDQPAALEAAEILALVARPSLWPEHSKRLAEMAERAGAQAAAAYYSRLMPFAYSQGPLGILGFLKWLLATLIGIFRPVPRGPYSGRDVEEICIKSVALAAENIMLAYRAEGYDSCPMEGFDEYRVKRILSLKPSDRAVMLIAAGKRAKGGVYSPRVRFPSKEVASRV